MLEIRHLEKRYSTGDLALKNIDLKVQSGEVVGLIGPSGAGKSSLIRCINRLIMPSAGEILLEGRDLVKLSNNELRQARRH